MISIIVPVYNGEKYLRECIDSIICQKEVPIEVLLIDDGSTDSSLEICREYEKIDSRIVVIHKENTGVSDTRNLGIEIARGEYIMFVDADDFLHPSALQKVSLCLQAHQFPDMVIWGFEITPKCAAGDGEMIAQHTDGFAPKELLHHIISIDSKKRLMGFVWRCAYKKEMLNKNRIRFSRELKMAEDFKFLLEAVLASGEVPVLNDSLYYYRKNDSSVTARYKENVHRDMLSVNQWMEETICSKYPEFKVGLDCCCAETYIGALQNLCNPGSIFGLRQRIRMAKEMKAQHCYGDKIKVALFQRHNLTLKRRMVYAMLLLGFEPIYIFLFSIKKKTICVR